MSSSSADSVARAWGRPAAERPSSSNRHPKGGEDGLELARERRLGADELAARGRGELQAPGVEEEPAEALRTLPPHPAAVERVPRHRVADRVEVDPDLVGAPGHEVELEERPAGEPLPDPVARRGRPAVGHDRHPDAVLRGGPAPRPPPPPRRPPPN